jgi:KDO2-lipid IV(A) lauroyltransferase
MGTQTKETGSWGDWIVDRLLRGAIGLALALPYRRRVELMGALTQRVIAPLFGYRKRARRNLAYVYPEMAEQERWRIADAACDNAGRAMIEVYSRPDLIERAKSATVSGDGLDAIAEAKATGRPILFVTGHFGNHDGARTVLNNKGYEVGILYRAMANPFFNTHYQKMVGASGGAIFEQGRAGTTAFVRHLKRGGMACILFDIYQRKGPKIDFLGRPAHSSTSAAELALRYNALVVPVFCTRLSDGLNFHVDIEAPVPHTTAVEMTRQMTQRLEVQVARNPEQWFWVHRRWKPAV